MEEQARRVENIKSVPPAEQAASHFDRRDRTGTLMILLYLIGLGLPLLVIGLKPFWAMLTLWVNDLNHAHGLFVLPLTAYFIWIRRDDVLAEPAGASWLGVGLVAAGVLIAIVTSVSPSLFRANLSLIVIAIGLVLAIEGWRRFRLIALPLIYLFFMLPLPSHISTKVAVPLQQFASATSTRALRLIGVPALHEGYVIELPGRTLVVGEACSGINLLMGFLALGFVFAYLSKRRTWFRTVLFSATIPIALLVNVVRVTVTGLIHHYLDPRWAEGFLHFFEGYVLFIAGIILFYIIYKLLFVFADQLEIDT